MNKKRKIVCIFKKKKIYISELHVVYYDNSECVY